MSLKDQTSIMLPAIEAELKHQIARFDTPRTKVFHEMLTYHMGWTGESSGMEVQGKRIRPLLVLCAVASCGEQWLRAISAAAAVELVHNFSLVHDDIQDNSPKRRGRLTVWKKWNMAQAINAGDALFVISNQAMMDLSASYPPGIVMRAASVLHNTCLDLTRGQFLDMSFENRTDLSIEDYWPMIEGKTAALLSACTQIGSILGNADDAEIEQYRIFGRDLGLAFQIQDDILGIWGDEALTGKSAASDLVEGKNSLPVIFGISQKGRFAQRWAASAIRPDEVTQIAQMLVDEGAYRFSQQEAQRLTAQALDALTKANPRGEAGKTLFELARKLLNRES
ncbi:MAG: polyprenyl synthetase family protein [Chloroflexi bacterium]|nr:polyprenyl synthetase family protein [Chloroflexota bacterium]MBI3339656.1 polyprenyl synthetase family protein [Chloroflexota bacterium]